MAGDWIKVEHATPDKPEVFQMSAVLGIDPDEVFGKLIRFWVWADQQMEKCNAEIVTGVTALKLIDRVVRNDGFAQAMVDVGWLTVNDEGMHIPKFDRHNGQTAKNRALTKNRVQKSRAKCNDPDVTDVTHPSLQDRYQRREEKSLNDPLPPLQGESCDRDEASPIPTEPSATTIKKPEPRWVPYEPWMSAELREAFDDWHSHLIEIGYSPRTMQQRTWRMECQRNINRAVEVIRFSISKGAKSLLFDSISHGRSGGQPQKDDEVPSWKEERKPLPDFFQKFLDERPIYVERTDGKARGWKFEDELPLSVRDDFSDWRGSYLRAKKTNPERYTA